VSRHHNLGDPVNKILPPKLQRPMKTYEERNIPDRKKGVCRLRGTDLCTTVCYTLNLHVSAGIFHHQGPSRIIVFAARHYAVRYL